MRKILSLVLGLLWALPVWGANCNLFDISQSPTTENISSNLIWTRYNINVSSTSLSVGNWTAKHTDFISPGTYTITFNGTNSSVAIRGYDGSNLSLLRRGNGSFTITNPTQIWIFVADPETMARITEIMLEQGSTATPYQPYNATCDDRCKNLLNPNSLVQRGIQDNNGATAAENEKRVAMIDYIPVTPGQRYIFSSSNSDIVFHGSYFYDENKNHLLTGQHSRIATVPENAKYMRFSLQVSDGNNPLSVQDVLNANPQLEQGSTATEYVPYNAACHNNKITIATTKYNESAFSPLNTALQNAISVVDTVVSNTITQAGRIATLQTQKQTRPNDIADDNEKCPSGKKCLLVEDASGVPHWYEIVENAWSTDYTVLQYISSSGTQWIDTGYVLQSDDITFEWTAIDRADGNSSLFGSEVSSTPQYSVILYGSKTSRTLYIARSSAVSVGYASGDSNFHSWVLSVTSDHKVTLSKDGVRVGEGNWSGDIQKQKSIGIFENNHQRQIASLTLKSFSITDGGVLVRNMIPMKRKIDDAVGLYDTVNNRFYTNAGTGEFTAGPVVE